LDDGWKNSTALFRFSGALAEWLGHLLPDGGESSKSPHGASWEKVPSHARFHKVKIDFEGGGK
jgi:hypothetical protein